MSCIKIFDDFETFEFLSCTNQYEIIVDFDVKLNKGNRIQQTISLLTIVLKSVVEVENRSFSITMQIFFIHLLGDFPSPFVIGVSRYKVKIFIYIIKSLLPKKAIADRTGSLRTAMIFCCLWMLYAILFFGLSLSVIRSHESARVVRVTNSSVEIIKEIELKEPTEFTLEN